MWNVGAKNMDDNKGKYSDRKYLQRYLTYITVPWFGPQTQGSMGVPVYIKREKRNGRLDKILYVILLWYIDADMLSKIK